MAEKWTSIPLLQTLELGRRVGEQWLLRNVNLTIRAGERLAIVGSSGSGKTLLLRALALLDPLETGQLHWQGHVVPRQQVPWFRSQVIYVHQRPWLDEGTVEDSLRLPFGMQVHQARSFDRQRIVDLLPGFQRNESFLNKLTGDLSGGEAQIVNCLRALQLDPRILLLDEPTAALDREAAGAIERLVGDWMTSDGTRSCVWVSHDFDQARRMATRICRMAAGRLSEADDGVP